MYVYIQSEPSLWTVGFYDSGGRFQPDSDWDSKDQAAKRVMELNGRTSVAISGEEPVVVLLKAIKADLMSIKGSLNQIANRY